MVPNITMLFNCYWVEDCREIAFYSQIDGSKKLCTQADARCSQKL